MKEHRCHVRVPLRLEVGWNGASGAREAVTTDISLGGCYVDSLAQMEVGKILSIEINLRTDRLSLYGEVLYQHPTIGFGVRFRNLTDFQRSMLALLINRALTTPAPMKLLDRWQVKQSSGTAAMGP